MIDTKHVLQACRLGEWQEFGQELRKRWNRRSRGEFVWLSVGEPTLGIKLPGLGDVRRLADIPGGQHDLLRLDFAVPMDESETMLIIPLGKDRGHELQDRVAAKGGWLGESRVGIHETGQAVVACSHVRAVEDVCYVEDDVMSGLTEKEIWAVCCLETVDSVMRWVVSR